MISALFTAIVAASAAWVYWDATGHGIGRIPEEKGFLNTQAGVWAIAVLLLWIIAFPLYLTKRSALLEKAKATPIAVTGRNGKMAMLCLAGGLWTLLNFASAYTTEQHGDPMADFTLFCNPQTDSCMAERINNPSGRDAPRCNDPQIMSLLWNKVAFQSMPSAARRNTGLTNFMQQAESYRDGMHLRQCQATVVIGNSIQNDLVLVFFVHRRNDNVLVKIRP